MTSWQPIETYDCDVDFEVLLADEDGSVGVGYAYEEGTGTRMRLVWWIGSCVANPTHWMPLPKHPKELENDQA